jgi:hypothetical protein
VYDFAGLQSSGPFIDSLLALTSQAPMLHVALNASVEAANDAGKRSGVVTDWHSARWSGLAALTAGTLDIAYFFAWQGFSYRKRRPGGGCTPLLPRGPNFLGRNIAHREHKTEFRPTGCGELIPILVTYTIRRV